MKKFLLSTLSLLPLLATSQLVINEVASNNDGYYDDEDNEFPDWIEIYNAGATTVNIGAYALTDDLDLWNQWLLPAIDVLPGQRKIIFASEKNRDCFDCGGVVNYMHTNFKISTGETIALYDAAGILLDSLTINDLHAGHSMARLPDGASWCYAETPTPNAANSGTCYSGYANPPIITTTAGFYMGSVDVSITGTEVYYTTDGNWPATTDDLYTAPINISANAVVKAVQVEAGKLPSRAVTASYFIDETTALPVVSLSGRPCDFFDIAPCHIGAYDNASGWEPDNIQVPGTVEFFSVDHAPQFSEDIKFEVAGNSSLAYYDQRGIQFTEDEDFNSVGEMNYNLFYHDKPGIDSIQGFRCRAMNDWGNSNARMKDLIVNRLALPTFATAAGYQNVVTYINGEYWGHYAAREELDRYFLRNNLGCDPDSVVIIRSGAGEDVWDIAEAGSITEYNNLKSFFNTHDMSDPDDYALALDLIDMQNWVDYWCVQVFINNDETAYNIRCYKSYDPDIKWRMWLWDCGAGSEGETVNSLTTVLQYVYTSDEVNMINDLLENDEFKTYFINRYADLLNTQFQYSNVEALIDSNVAEIEDEIPAQDDRWGSPSVAQFNSAVDLLKGFYDNRVYYQRNDIENHFNLDDQVDVTLEVNPPEAGFIKISTIIPENLPWTGVYFDGNPVTVTAIPNPGYEFSSWDSNIFIDDESLLAFTTNISDNTTFTANFNGSAIANPVIISEVNFNSDSTINSGDWIELHNTSGSPVNISDYVFSNKKFYNNFYIPTNTVIPANGYLVLTEDKNEFLTQHPAVTNVLGDFTFNLQNDGDSVSLKDMHGNMLSTFRYNDKRPWPYTADGFGRTMEVAADLADPKLPESWFAGCMGGSPGEPFALCYENPLVDEINYNSLITEDAGDWFELYSYSGDDLDLSGWLVKDKNKNTFVIPDGTILPANGYLVFFQDDAKFTAQFPEVTNKIGPLNFGFDGQGDVVLLYDPTGILYQSVGFDDEAPYPISSDGGGTALQIVNISLNLNDPSNWTESCPEGSPGVEFTMPCANAIEEEEIISSMLVFPDPAEQLISLSLPTGITGEISMLVYDIAGKIVMQEELNSVGESIDISGLTPGLYHIELQCDNERFTSTFIKL